VTFLLKKIFSRLFFPLSLIVELMIVGFLLPKKGRKFIATGVILLYLFSFTPFARFLLWPLERQYPVISASAVQKKIKWVVVLGGGSRSNRSLTWADRLDDASLKRLLEGMRLYRHLPEARLVLSGGDYRGLSADARIMGQVAIQFGLPSSRLILEESSWDTIDEVRLLKKIVGQDPFYLVTSASHMPRSMTMFKKAGNYPIAAPTDFQALWEPLKVTDFFPQAAALMNTERAFYEYLGLLWGWVRGYL
jgi:uncharacterized SAM-binding protein YcdF (DUF218 family)